LFPLFIKGLILRRGLGPVSPGTSLIRALRVINRSTSKAYPRLFWDRLGMAGDVFSTERQGLVSGLRGVDGVLIEEMHLTYQLEFKIKKALGISQQHSLNE
jgi:hypothetical protein